MNDNFVGIVGYQLEKVHTGMIKWLLDSKNHLVPLETKYEILRRIFKMTHTTMGFSSDAVKEISCFTEYSFGRKRKIDLVIKIDLYHNSTKYIVIEMKVDSIPYSEQLEGTKKDFLEAIKCPSEDVIFLLMLFGSSQVCEVPQLYDFHLFRLPEIIEVFNGLYIDNVIYEQWIDSLFNEDFRGSNILTELDNVTDLWNMEYWNDKGYRTPFPLFYYLYHHLRLESKKPEEWEIYSGQNNPVMNWTNGWLKKDVFEHPVQFYWEFNYDEFVLKVLLDEKNKLSRDDLNWLREEISKICYQESSTGYPTKKTYGTFNSVYKWKFDFKSQPFKDIMKQTDDILDKIPPLLAQI